MGFFTLELNLYKDEVAPANAGERFADKFVKKENTWLF